MKTELALLLMYESPTASLEQAAEFIGLDARSLQNKIYDQTAPIPMFKVGNKWRAHIKDMADYIDAQRADAMKLLQKARQAA